MGLGENKINFRGGVHIERVRLCLSFGVFLQKNGILQAESGKGEIVLSKDLLSSFKSLMNSDRT